MPRIRLHDPMKHSIQQDMMFHTMYAEALKNIYRRYWIDRLRNWLGL